MGLTADIASTIVGTKVGDIPDAVLDQVRRAVTDGVGVALAGSCEAPTRILLDVVPSPGDGQTAAIWGYTRRTDPVNAAFVNGTSCHVLDFEPMWSPPTHPTGPLLPAVLAWAEQGVMSGRTALTALALGYELQGALRLAIVRGGNHEIDGPHPPGAVGAIGAAAALSWLMRSPAEQVAMAISMAASRAAGIMANTGTMTKSTHVGNAARMGLESAILVRRGMTAAVDALDAPHGYFSTFWSGRFDPSPLTDYLRSYRLLDPGLAIKLYPSQYPTHWSIQAAESIASEAGFDPGDVVDVEVLVGADNEAAATPRPRVALAGKFHLGYCVAAALLDGHVNISTFHDDSFARPALQRMLDLVRITRVDGLSAMDFGRAWSVVRVWFADGTVGEHRVDRPLGIWDNPAGEDRLDAKFLECATRSLPETQSRQLMSCLRRITDLADVAEIPRLCTPGGPPER